MLSALPRFPDAVRRRPGFEVREAKRGETMNTDTRKICLWSGYAFFVLYLIGIVAVAGFVPPPSPSLGAEAVAAFFNGRHARVLIGMSICAFASPLYLAWGVALLAQMFRMEKPRFPALSVAQGISAGVGAMFFALSPLMWLTVTFRAGHAADTAQTLNDFAWISWIVSWPFFALQAAALGVCILVSPQPPMPRWLGYLSLWFALSMFPASAIVFFKVGPLAWNGVFALYLPLAMFALWFNVVTYWVARATNGESITLASDSGIPGRPDNGHDVVAAARHGRPGAASDLGSVADVRASRF
jgi:hypothetical protein